jgi:hypothetical protein
MAERRNWLLLLIPAVRRGRWLAAMAIGGLLLGTYWVLGMFGTVASERVSPSGLTFFAVILAYIIPIYHFINERTEKAFADLTPTLAASPDEVRAWAHSIAHKTPRWHLEILAWSTLAWVSHVALLYGSPGRVVSAAFNDVHDAVMVANTAVVWIVMTSAIFALIHNARMFNRLARRVSVDLLHTELLTPFGRVAVISTLALIGAQAAFPLLWLNSELLTSLPGLIATAVPMVFLFLLPVWPVHRAIAAAKAAELERIGQLIDQFGSTPPETAEGFARLNPLLVYRREVAEVSEWPFNTSIMTRLCFYLIIPPLTWIGAALIENVVDTFL